MISKLAFVPLILGLFVLPTPLFGAEDPPVPATTTSTNTAPAPRPKATNILNGKVDKISDTSITLKVTYQTGGKHAAHHANPAYLSSGWLPVIVPGVAPNPTPNQNGKSHSVTRTITLEVGETPPVKVVTNGPHPSRTTGAYSDLKVGDMVTLGTGPFTIKNADGTFKKRTQVTGIDVLKHTSAQNSTTSSSNKPPAKN